MAGCVPAFEVAFVECFDARSWGPSLEACAAGMPGRVSLCERRDPQHWDGCRWQRGPEGGVPPRTRFTVHPGVMGCVFLRPAWSAGTTPLLWHSVWRRVMKAPDVSGLLIRRAYAPIASPAVAVR